MWSQVVALGRRRVPKCWLEVFIHIYYIETAFEEEAFKAITHSSKSFHLSIRTQEAMSVVF